MIAWLMYGHALLAVAVPAPRVGLVRRVELGVGAERGEERRLVVGRAAQPAVGDARPRGDRVAPGHLLLRGARRAEIPVREAAPFGRPGQHVLAGPMVVVQGVVEAGEHAGGVPEGRVRGTFFTRSP